MKTILKSAILVTALAATLPAAEAATASGNFNLTVNLLGACRISTAPGLITINYTAFQGTDGTGSTPFAVQCSSNLAYTMAVSLPGANNIATSLGLTVTSIAPSAAGNTGSGVAQPYTVDAVIAQGQAGICNSSTVACTATNAYTLTISY